MINIKRILSCLVMSVVSVSLIAGCESGFKKKENKEIIKKSIFYMYDKDSKDIFTLNDKNEKSKIASDMDNIKYSDELQSYIVCDKDKGLYILDNEGGKDKIGSDVVFDKVQVEGSQNIYFLTTNSDLYVKEKDIEKEKIASGVSDYYAVNGKTIIYTDSDNSLFIKKENSEKEKLVSSVSDFRLGPDLKYCAYVNEDSLYLKDFEKDDKEKISDKNSGSAFEFAGNDAVVYFEDYNPESGKGELYIKHYGADKKKIASDVTSMKVYGDGVFYINSDRQMYYKKYNEEEKTKILEDAENMITSSDGSMFVCDKDKNVYKINNNNEKEKLVQDEENYKVTKSSIAVLNKDKDLYFGSTKIGSDVTAYSVSQNDVAYINSSKEVYLSKNGAEAEKVITDAKEFGKILFNNDLLYINTLTADDIKGFWKAENSATKEAIYFNFVDNKNISTFGFDQAEITGSYVVENSTPDVITITSEGERINISKKDNNMISLKFDTGEAFDLHSITEDEYNKMKNIVSIIYPVAVQEFGFDMIFFDSVKTIDGKTYYVYNTKEGDYGSALYIDEGGSKYAMSESGLVSYGTVTNSQEKSFSQDVALQYAKDYCTNTYSQNNDIQFLVGDNGYESGKAYYRIKLSSPAAISQGGSGSMGWIKVFEDGTVYND